MIKKFNMIRDRHRLVGSMLENYKIIVDESRFRTGLNRVK